jgi:hypothetical protein
MMSLSALVSGTVGATTLTLLHETVRRVLPEAPRADVLGMRALEAGLRGLGKAPPDEERLHRWALLGDLVANSAYYSLVGGGSVRHPWRRGTVLGLLAGLGAVALPGPLGLGRQPTNRTWATQAMTVMWYFVGGLAAAAAAQRLRAASPQADAATAQEAAFGPIAAAK